MKKRKVLEIFGNLLFGVVAAVSAVIFVPRLMDIDDPIFTWSIAIFFVVICIVGFVQGYLRGNKEPRDD